MKAIIIKQMISMSLFTMLHRTDILCYSILSVGKDHSTVYVSLSDCETRKVKVLDSITTVKRSRRIEALWDEKTIPPRARGCPNCSQKSLSNEKSGSVRVNADPLTSGKKVGALR